MIAKRIPALMPPMDFEELPETTKIHSICGLLASGSNPSPGKVTLAHNGVLFLDELPEFKRSTLEVFRHPMEDHQVTIARRQWFNDLPRRQ